jgi:DNA gyrase subunit A
MLENERPDLTGIPQAVQEYIAALEAALAQLQAGEASARSVEPEEPPTTIQVISMSRKGVAKRTPRHFYGRQRRSGMGVFDLEVAAPDVPAHVALVDEAGVLLVITSLGRVFRLPVTQIEETAVRAAGVSLALPLYPHEQIVRTLPADDGRYLILVSQRGWVQRVAVNYVGKSLIAGMTFHDTKRGGQVTGACWAPDQGELFIATRNGLAIRFLASQVPASGCLGLRVDQDDEVVAVTAVTEASGVLLISQDGKGTIRQMAGFRLNKAPGAGGKQAIKTDHLVTVLTVNATDDIFLLSETSKIIRFKAEEIPAKEGVVQGVNCMSLRNDQVMAAAVAPMPAID